MISAGTTNAANLQVVKTVIKGAWKAGESHYVRQRPRRTRYALCDRSGQDDAGSSAPEPTTTFDEGIKKTVKWYLENEEWWKNVDTAETISNITKRCMRIDNGAQGSLS